MICTGLCLHTLVNLVGSDTDESTDGDSAHETTIPARGKALVDTDISIAVPIGTCKFHFIPYSDKNCQLIYRGLP